MSKKKVAPATGKRKFLVTAEVTISIYTVVEAETAIEAERLAGERSIMSLCHQCAGSEGEDDEWRSSGELDGEPGMFCAEVYE